MKKYKLAACGGTFDLFHKGHEKFLHTVFTNSQKVIIGLTSDDFVLQKKTFEKFSYRKISLQNFLDTFNYDGEIIQIDDIYGPTISDKYSFDCLFITDDSLRGGEKINEKRKELGLSPLKIIKLPLLKTKDGRILSTTRIKNGAIDRNGESYIDERILSYDYVLPDAMREKLSMPFGRVLKETEIENQISNETITVGDETAKSFFKKKIYPRLAIIDLRNNRVKKYRTISDLGLRPKKIIKAINPSGHITKELFEAVINGLKSKNSVILVDGEEDLAVIPAVLAAPLGYKIYYGQPSEGVVQIEVTEEKKMEIKKLISKFTRKVI